MPKRLPRSEDPNYRWTLMNRIIATVQVKRKGKKKKKERKETERRGWAGSFCLG